MSLSFALLYLTCRMPLGWLAGRNSRRNIVAAG